ncbi:putative chch domain-containing protein [Phaeomoniella chlamydospora]|uniref:Putative chch domain-containing protein n=1 Tax=Phaeomoniella chlamydospora TaxID=158046 RepID=A0A0G2E4J5_PHACM|nr:putative chch domain-containing protein [Phaeomoniella chlamydospora]
MPRQSRGRSSAPAPSRAPTRPQAVPARPAAPQQQQTRPASTAAYPPPAQVGHPPAGAQQAPPQASQGPGLFGQMASTAAGVAVGSSIGHAVGSMFTGWGGSSSEPAAQQQQQQQSVDAYAKPMDANLYGNATQSNYATENGPCAADIKSFNTCMTEHQGNMSICGWYLDQLKACTQAARQY